MLQRSYVSFAAIVARSCLTPAKLVGMLATLLLSSNLDGVDVLIQ